MHHDAERDGYVDPAAVRFGNEMKNFLGHHSGLVCYTSIDNLNAPPALYPEEPRGGRQLLSPGPSISQ